MISPCLKHYSSTPISLRIKIPCSVPIIWFWHTSSAKLCSFHLIVDYFVGVLIFCHSWGMPNSFLPWDLHTYCPFPGKISLCFLPPPPLFTLLISYITDDRLLTQGWLLQPSSLNKFSFYTDMGPYIFLITLIIIYNFLFTCLTT